MKKFLALLLALVMVFALAACGETANNNNEPAAKSANDVADEMTSSDGKYQVGFVTDVGQLKDKSFNEGTWNGVKLYADANGKSYKYYQPANGNNATDDDRIAAFNAACDGGAEIVVAAGFLQAGALTDAAIAHPDVKFVFIDGWTLTDANGNALPNVVAIAFHEEQCGYFAGYAVVKEGYTKLGFSGGGGGTNPACCRYGYGFVQGANAAAAELGVNVEIKYSWEYGSNYSASAELQTMANGWYEQGTEVIFACGGSMFQSISAAAAANDAYVVGVDVDQSGDSDTVITSAMKGLADAVDWACKHFYGGTWDTIGGTTANLGVAENAVGLPTETWSLQKYTVAEYEELFKKVVDGSVVIDADYEANFDQAYSNVTVDLV